jgi:hypothetical protein
MVALRNAGRRPCFGPTLGNVPAQQPAPVVTITDPNHPGVLHDVVPEPRRPHEKLPRPVATTAFAAALALVLELGVAVVLRHDDQQHRLDLASVSEISVRVVDNGVNDATDSPDAVALVLRNDGDSGLDVLSARIDREGYPEQQFDKQLGPSKETPLLIQMQQPCPRSLRSGPTGVLVTLRTARKQVTTMRIPVQETTFSNNYLVFQQEHCSLQDIYSSLTSDVVGSAVVGKALRLTLAITNQSVLGREVVSMHPPVGFNQLSVGPLPLAVPRKGTAQVQMTVSVQDCGRARSALRSGDNVYVAIVVRGDQTEDLADLYLGDGFVQRLQEYLDASCPKVT